MTREISGRRLSRRGFVGSGAGAAGLLAAGVGFGGGASAAPVEAPAEWDLEADVVVVGFGGAGTTAAIEAAEAGARVLAIEKASNAGGNTVHSGGVVYLGGGTPIQVENGFDDTPDNMYTYLADQMGPTANKEKIRLYADDSVNHFQWLTERGVPFFNKFWEGKVVQPPADEGGLYFTGNELNSPYSELVEPMPRGHMPPGAGAGTYTPLRDAALELGVEVMFNTAAERLVVDAEGRVAGILVRTGVADPGQPEATPVGAAGELFVRATRGVVLTAGGFQFNQEMMAEYAPWYLEGAPLGGPHQGDDGSGIKMGMAVGGAHYDLSFASPWKFVYAPGEMCEGVLVDGIGSRFVGESSYGQTVGDAIFRRNGGVAWLIMDQGVVERAGEAGGFVSDPDATADTIEELAEQLGLSPAVLANTIAFYNEHAAQGEDPLMHKHAEFLRPLEMPPFVAFDFGASTGIPFITLGGLRTDINQQVVDNFGEVIPGLYAAGRTAPGINPEYYVSGSALADCTYFGRVAGRAAAGEE